MYTWNPQDYAQHSRSQEAWAHELLDLLDLQPGDVVLDIGCGDGRTTLAIAKRVPEGHVVGVDLSAEMVGHAAAEHCRAPINNLRFAQADASAPPFMASRKHSGRTAELSRNAAAKVTSPKSLLHSSMSPAVRGGGHWWRPGNCRIDSIPRRPMRVGSPRRAWRSRSVASFPRTWFTRTQAALSGGCAPRGIPTPRECHSSCGTSFWKRQRAIICPATRPILRAASTSSQSGYSFTAKK